MRELFRAEQLPLLQNKLYDSPEAARSCPLGDLVLVQDLETGLVFNRAFQPVRYDPGYRGSAPTSPIFLSHLAWAASQVKRHLAGRALLEIGCGQGLFLSHLEQSGLEVRGLDPAYRGRHPAICRAAYSGQAAEGFVLRHVLEHLDDPLAFLARLREASPRARVYLEVPCLDWILEHRAWYDLYHEHVNYFRLDDFRRMFCRLELAEPCFGSQYLAVVADLDRLRVPRLEDAVVFPADFARRPDVSERPVTVWGAASRGVIFSLALTRAGHPPERVVDIDPGRQGRYLPVTGIQVSPTESLAPGSNIYVMNANYLSEIRARGGASHAYRVVAG